VQRPTMKFWRRAPDQYNHNGNVNLNSTGCSTPYYAITSLSLNNDTVKAWLQLALASYLSRTSVWLWTNGCTGGGSTSNAAPAQQQLGAAAIERRSDKALPSPRTHKSPGSPPAYGQHSTCPTAAGRGLHRASQRQSKCYAAARFQRPAKSYALAKPSNPDNRPGGDRWSRPSDSHRWSHESHPSAA